MNTLEALHDEAMDLAEEAFSAKRSGEAERARALFRESLARESQVVEMVKARFDYEPTRSIILLGAASLASNTGELDLAKRLAYMGLSGTPPDNVRDDLEHLLSETTMELEAAAAARELPSTAIGLAIDGSAVVADYTEAEPFVSRVTSLARLFRRTYERVRGEPYRETGCPNLAVRVASRPFMSLTQPGSYRVTLRFGVQGELPVIGTSQQAIQDLMGKLEVLQSQGLGALDAAIPDPAYRNNFVGLAKRLAPDGRHVSSVLLAANVGEEVSTLPLSQDLQRIPVRPIARGRHPGKGKPVEVMGLLRHASKEEDEESSIRLVDEGGKRHVILVPTGMMNDIVKPLWDEQVRVTGMKVGRLITMENITPVSTDV